jgi:hypothetical protein
MFRKQEPPDWTSLSAATNLEEHDAPSAESATIYKPQET